MSAESEFCPVLALPQDVGGSRRSQWPAGPMALGLCPGSHRNPHLDWQGRVPTELHTMGPFLTSCTCVLSLVGVAVALRVGEQLRREGSGGEDPSSQAISSSNRNHMTSAWSCPQHAAGHRGPPGLALCLSG